MNIKYSFVPTPWEYYHSVEEVGRLGCLDLAYNALGRQGWELVFAWKERSGKMHAIFKRPITLAAEEETEQ